MSMNDTLLLLLLQYDAGSEGKDAVEIYDFISYSRIVGDSE